MLKRFSTTMLCVSAVAFCMHQILSQWWIDQAVGPIVITKTYGGTSPSGITLSTQSKNDVLWSRNDLAELLHPPKEHSHWFSKNASDDFNGDEKAALYYISAYYGLPKELLYYQHLKESEGDCSAVSHKSAEGCFQFMDSTAKQFGLIHQDSNGQWIDSRSSLLASADTAGRYLVWLSIVIYGDDVDLKNWDQLEHVLAAFNAGISRVKVAGKDPKVPSFDETASYVHQLRRVVDGRSYYVRPGDDLQKISMITGYTAPSILRSNPGVDDEYDIKAGSIIALPDLSTGTAEVLLSRKRPLSFVSKGTGLNADELVAFNKMDGRHAAKPGTVIKIPINL